MAYFCCLDYFTLLLEDCGFLSMVVQYTLTQEEAAIGMTQ
jgi:hypothetical protein